MKISGREIEFSETDLKQHCALSLPRQRRLNLAVGFQPTVFGERVIRVAVATLE